MSVALGTVTCICNAQTGQDAESWRALTISDGEGTCIETGIGWEWLHALEDNDGLAHGMGNDGDCAGFGSVGPDS